MKVKPDRDCRACALGGRRSISESDSHQAEAPDVQLLIVPQQQEVVRLSTTVPKLWKELDLVQAGLR